MHTPVSELFDKPFLDEIDYSTFGCRLSDLSAINEGFLMQDEKEEDMHKELFKVEAQRMPNLPDSDCSSDEPDEMDDIFFDMLGDMLNEPEMKDTSSESDERSWDDYSSDDDFLEDLGSEVTSVISARPDGTLLQMAMCRRAPEIIRQDRARRSFPQIANELTKRSVIMQFWLPTDWFNEDMFDEDMYKTDTVIVISPKDHTDTPMSQLLSKIKLMNKQFGDFEIEWVCEYLKSTIRSDSVTKSQADLVLSR